LLSSLIMPKDTFETFSQQKLTDAICQNDENVLKWIYQQNYSKVQQMVLANSGNVDQAKDIYQDAFLAFWTNVKTGKFRPENDTALSGYLYQISKNKWMDTCRSQAFKRTVFQEHFPDQIDEEEEDQEALLIRIEGAFAKLGENCRDLLTRYYYRKDSLSSLASHFGWTEATTKNNKYRCMERLRSSLKTDD
jgi:RNA polymerase sigma factor (sigma-70 family)